MIDFHCHLDLYPEPQTVVRECEARSLYVLSVTTTPSAWEGTQALAANGKRIRTALGLHPQLAHERRGELELFTKFLPRTRYVGEVGLDGAPEFRQHWHAQLAVFDHILAACSAAGGKVISIHSRRAAATVLDRLEAFPNAGIPVFHWFSGSIADLKRASAMGCWFSTGPTMLAGARGRALASLMPRERVLTETDGPFARINGKTAMPWDVETAVTALANVWQVSPSEAHHLISDNLTRLATLSGREATA